MDSKQKQNVRSIVSEMLSDRGYQIVKKVTKKVDSDKDSDSDDVEDENTPMYAVSRVIKNKTVMVIYDFVSGSKIKKDTLQMCVKLMEEYGYSRIILVYNDSTTSAAESLIASLAEQDKIIEVCNVRDMTYNPIKHYLQPKFQKISSIKEKKQIYSTLGPAKNFGAMVTTDPVARWYDYKIDDLIKITRKDGSIYYRRVKK